MRKSSRVVRSRPFERWAILGVLGLPACQWVFGDFSQTDEDPVSTGGATSTATGGSPSTGGSTSVTATSACPTNDGFFCKAGVLIDCKTGETTPCGSDSLCRADLKKCLTCASGSYGCQGSIILQCNDAQTGWDPYLDCTNNAEKPYCETGVPECVTCVRGNQICQGSTLRTCSSTRTWIDVDCAASDGALSCVTDSESKAHCERCDPATFVNACSGNNLMTCVVDQIDSRPCPSACVPASGNTPARCE